VTPSDLAYKEALENVGVTGVSASTIARDAGRWGLRGVVGHL